MNAYREALAASPAQSTERCADESPCPDPRCNDTLGAMPIPQCVTAVAWAEEADKLRQRVSEAAKRAAEKIWEYGESVKWGQGRTMMDCSEFISIIESELSKG